MKTDDRQLKTDNGGAREKVVVCIDDNAAVLEAYEILLKDRCRVLTAASAEEGLRLVRDQQPDLVILDLLMSELPGDEVARRIRTGGYPCRILVVSASAREHQPEAYARLDRLRVDWILPKPFDMIRFLVVVSGLLESPLARVRFTSSLGASRDSPG